MKLAVIGYGFRMNELCDRYLLHNRLGVKVEVAAVVDPRHEQLAEKLGKDWPGVALFESVAEFVAAGVAVDGLMIGTRCDLHTGMFCELAALGLPVFLEKPVAISLEQLGQLRAASRAPGCPPVVVSFPLRRTIIAQRIKEIIDSGMIGTIEQVQYINNVSYGDVYFHDWYRDAGVTGGLFLQKATHDFDLIHYFLDEYPAQVAAMTSRRVYGGTMPADLKCEQCDRAEQCPDSPFALYFNRFEYEEIPSMPQRHCCYAQGIENEDNGSALLEFPSGRQAVYSQNFFVKKRAGRRGAMLLGSAGSIDFDFYRAGEEIRVHLYNSPRNETIGLEGGNLPHWGGDLRLMKNFTDVIAGRAQSLSPLEAGMMSALTSLRARQAAGQRRYCSVDLEDLA